MAFSRFLSPNSTYVTKPDESVILCESLTITSCIFLTFQATCYYVSVLSHRLQYSILFWLFPSCSSCVLLELKIIYIYIYSCLRSRQDKQAFSGTEWSWDLRQRGWPVIRKELKNPQDLCVWWFLIMPCAFRAIYS